jgi:hypothetical protein
MGVYFIAAGSSSRNREKTLDKSFQVKEICEYVSTNSCDKLGNFFPNGQDIYLWGANNDNEIKKVKTDEYVVDVKNKKIVQVFQYCYFVKTENTRLQEYLGWDREKPDYKKRQFRYVYFLRNPKKTTKSNKSFFQEAFGLLSNQNWLVAQKYFDNEKIMHALVKTNSKNIEEFLGITNANNTPNHEEIILGTEDVNKDDEEQNKKDTTETPDWLKNNIDDVFSLKRDPQHLERDHEILVVELFSLLGYSRFRDIKHQRGNIDIRIDKEDKPLIVIEVKADWSLNRTNKEARKQAFGYALNTGARYVIITNGDYYCLYDRQKGLSYEDCFVCDFHIANLSKNDEQALEMLKKCNLK